MLAVDEVLVLNWQPVLKTPGNGIHKSRRQVTEDMLQSITFVETQKRQTQTDRLHFDINRIDVVESLGHISDSDTMGPSKCYVTPRGWGVSAFPEKNVTKV